MTVVFYGQELLSGQFTTAHYGITYSNFSRQIVVDCTSLKITWARDGKSN